MRLKEGYEVGMLSTMLFIGLHNIRYADWKGSIPLENLLITLCKQTTMAYRSTSDNPPPVYEAMT